MDTLPDPFEQGKRTAKEGIPANANPYVGGLAILRFGKMGTNWSQVRSKPANGRDSSDGPHFLDPFAGLIHRFRRSCSDRSQAPPWLLN
jgi:hypothetical protein